MAESWSMGERKIFGGGGALVGVGGAISDNVVVLAVPRDPIPPLRDASL